MLEFKYIQDAENKINKAMQLLGKEFNGFLLERHTELILDMLETITHDKYGDISYFIYELDWGRLWKEDSITDADGNSIPMGTIKDLYSYLEERYND